MKEHLQEATIVDMSDGDLKEFLGYHYEALKKLEDCKKMDPIIQELRAKLQMHIDSIYNLKSKSHKAKIKAARAIAELRGIKWSPPMELE